MSWLEIAGFGLAFGTALGGWAATWIRAREQEKIQLYGLKRDVKHLKRNREVISRELDDTIEKVEKIDDRLNRVEGKIFDD